MPKRILIVNNNEDLFEIVNEVLSYENFDVLTTSTSDDILQVVQNYNPHLIILDYHLGGSNGEDICRQLKAHEHLSHIPVMIFSAYINGDVDYPSALGCDAVIAKPFNLNELVDKVNHLTLKNPMYTL